MILKKITLNNIRSYQNQEIEFPEGSTLLSGDIGSGKTSILLGIEFALFGLQPGQRGHSILRNGEDNGGVTIEIEVEGKQVIIERTLKRGKTVSQDYAAITIDGEKNEISVTELKNRVLGLLNYPREFSKKQNILYKFTVYTPQEEMKQIIIQDSETRINTLRHVFGIDKYKRILENASTLISKIREEKRIKEALISNIDTDKEEIVLKETDLENKKLNLVSVERELFEKSEIRKKIQEDKETLVTKIEEKNRLQQEIEKTKLMISTKENSIVENEKIISQLSLQIEESNSLNFDESKINFLEQDIISLKKEKIILGEELLNLSTQINSLNSRNEESEKLKQKIQHLDSCPTCLQSVDSVYKSNVVLKIDSDVATNINQIRELSLEKIKLSEKISKMDIEISSREKEKQELLILKVRLQNLEEKKIRLKEIENSNISLGKDIEILKSHIETLRSSVFELTKFENIFNQKQIELENALRDEKLSEIKVAELKREISVFATQIDELKLKIQRLEGEKDKFIYLSNLEDWIAKKFIPIISEVEKNVMIKLKSEFSKLFAEWFSMLVSESFNVRLGDDFTPIIEQQDYEIDYAYLSGGERTAIALAYRLALNQVINSLMSKINTKDLVILDEPTDGFSEQQLDKMRSVLEQLNIAQLIIVSHEQKIEGFVDNVIKFKKENGKSRMDM